MLGPDGKPKLGGPQVLSEAQVLALRAVPRQSASPSAPQPDVSHAQMRSPTPLKSESDDSDELTWDQMQRRKSANPTASQEEKGRRPVYPGRM
jgi:hypothetical protein